MVAGRIIAGLVAGALGVAVLAVAPAIGATDARIPPVKRATAASLALGGFTPVAADPRLAAMFARGGLDTSGFRFTPAEVKRDSRAVTVAVRARGNGGGLGSRATLASAAAQPAMGLTPIAYNLGVAVGWRRFAVAGDVSRVDMAARPGSREAADVSVSYTASRFSSRVKAIADRPLAGAPALVEEQPSYSVDLSSSYSLTRNLDLTAGVRYRSDRERLARVDDGVRDSRAVYIGTAFRF